MWVLVLLSEFGTTLFAAVGTQAHVQNLAVHCSTPFFAAVGTHAHFLNLATSLAFLAPVATSLFRALQAAGSAAGIAAHLFLLPWAPRPSFIQNHMTVGTNDAGFEFEMLWCFEFDMLWSFASVFSLDSLLQTKN